MRKGLIIMAVFAFISGCTKQLPEEYTKRSSNQEDITGKLAKYATVKLDFDRSILSDSQIQVLEKLVEASNYIDQIFWHQADHYALAIRKELEKSADPIDADYLRFMNINYCQYDRQDGNKPFIGTREKPKGAGFYPEDLTKEEFEKYIQDHPEVEEEFNKLNTVIKRRGDNLITVPYEKEYRKYLEPASRLLAEAADLCENESLKHYLQLRSDALLAGDFFESDMAWMDLEGNLLDIVIGPIESYEDGLAGIKASYEALVLIKDPKESERFSAFKEHLGALEQHLPVSKDYKKSDVALSSSIGIFTSINRYGDSNAGTKTIAISLPNDEKVREQKGARSLQLKNVIMAKYDKILVPIAQRLIDEKQFKYVDGEAFFTNVLMHELAHPMGLNYVRGKENMTTRAGLQDAYSAIEEAKADVVGLYNIRYYVSQKLLPKDWEQKAYVTYLASIFRSVRFGASSAHGKANMLELNYLLKNRAITFDPKKGAYAVNFRRMKKVIRDLAKELLRLEGDGDFSGARAMLETYSTITPETQRSLNRLTDIPVDLVFEFPM